MKNLRFVLASYLLIGFLVGCVSDPTSLSTLPTLFPNQPTNGVIYRDQVPYNEFNITIPETALGIRLSLLEATADLDIILVHKESDEIVYRAESGDALEVATIYRHIESWFQSEEFIVAVSYPSDFWVRNKGMLTADIPFKIIYEIFDSQKMLTELIPGTKVEGEMNNENAYIAQYFLDIPPETEIFRIDVLETYGNLDFFVSRNEPVCSMDDFLIVSNSLSGVESVLVQVPQDSNETDRYYLLVSGNGLDFQYSLTVTPGENPPEDIPPIVSLPTADEGFDSTRLATVALYHYYEEGMGTGVLVNSEGLILSSRHVVIDISGKEQSMMVAIAFENSKKNEVLFIAETVRVDADLDLALLKITKDRWGRPLPDGYIFPYVPLGNPENLQPGDTLNVIGYPGIGSEPIGSYFTMSQGIFSGIYNSQMFKTDTFVTYGNSGGPILDINWQVVGIVEEITYTETGETLTNFIPVTLIPEEWRDMIEN